MTTRSNVEHARASTPARVQRDPGQVEQPANSLEATEQLERLGLRGHEVQLERHAHLERAAGEHQRQLVERQRPGRPGRDDERERAQVAAFDVLDDPVQALLVGQRAGERDGAGERRDRPRARRDQQHVVRQLLAGHGVHLARARGRRARRSRTWVKSASAAIRSSG